MKAILFFLVTVLMFTAPAFGAQLYGTLREGDRPVPQGVEVTVSCPGNPSHTGTTDASGVYRIYVPEKGRCTLQVQYNQQAASAEVYSFDDATKYDFDLIQQKSGYTLRRR